MRSLLQHGTESSIIPNSRERSVWRNKKAQKEERFPRGRQIAFLIYEYFQVIRANDSVENYADLFTIALRNDDSQNSIRNGTEFYSQWRKYHLMTSWNDCTNSEYESLRNLRPYWNCSIWRFIRRKLDLIMTDWRQWCKEVSSRIYESRILKPETEIMQETSWSRVRRQTSVNKEL